MDVDTLNSMSIAQLEVALDSNYGVFKAKKAGAEGDDVCNTYLATVKPIRAKLLSLMRSALGASKIASLPLADDAYDEPTINDTEGEPAAKASKFGKPKLILEGSKRLVSPEELQAILEKGQTAAACAAPRKVGTFQKKPKGFVSSVAPAVPAKVKVARRRRQRGHRRPLPNGVSRSVIRPQRRLPRRTLKARATWPSSPRSW